MNLYSVQEVAMTLGVSRQLVLKLIKRDGLGRRVGRAWLLDDTDVAALTARNRRPTGRPKAADHP